MKKFFNVKTISLLLAVILLVGGAVGGTLAWIIDTQTVTNTFTYGDINIELEETKTNEQGQPVDENNDGVNDKITDSTGNTYEMIPGSTYVKDPKITVKSGSEACWVFVKLEAVDDVGSVLTYAIADCWTKVEDNVYYVQVDDATADVELYVLKDNTVSVSGDVTKQQLTALNGKSPALKITAYAVQQANIADAATAWSYAKATPTP